MVTDYLLDTGVANRVATHDAATQRKIAEKARLIFVPDIVFGELYFGAYRYAALYQSTKFFDLYDDFRERFAQQILTCDMATAHIYGAIYAELSLNGQLI